MAKKKETSKIKFEDNKQYWAFTRFGAVKYYGKALNTANPEFLSQFVHFEEINR